MRKTPAILKGPGNAAAVASFLALTIVLGSYGTVRLAGRVPSVFTLISAAILFFYVALLPLVIMKKHRVFFATLVASFVVILGNLATQRHIEVVLSGDPIDSLVLLGAGYLSQIGLIFYSIRALREPRN